MMAWMVQDGWQQQPQTREARLPRPHGRKGKARRCGCGVTRKTGAMQIHTTP